MYKQPQQVIILNGSVRMKSCDIVLPTIHSNHSTSGNASGSTASTTATATIGLNYPIGSTGSNNSNPTQHNETETGRAIDNQYSFV